jgi:hypothetical protein
MAVKISQMPSAGAITGAEWVEVSRLSPAVTITATTLSASAADNSYSDSGNGFVSAGFAVGTQVRVQGFTAGANNLFSGTLTDVAAGKLTLSGTDGDAITTEAAGPSVTITAWETRRAQPAAPADPPPTTQPYDIHIGRAGVLTDAEFVQPILLPREVTFAANGGALSDARALVAATGSTTIKIRRRDGASWVDVFDVAWAAAGTTGAITGSAYTAPAGTLLGVFGPATADATLADVAIVLVGTRAAA